MSKKELDIDTFAKLLTDARFEEIFEYRQDLDQFWVFLRNRAIPAGGFVISFPISEGGLMWMSYEIKNVRGAGTKLDLGEQTLFYSDDPSDRTIPEECQKYPVWSLEEQYKKQND